MANYYAHCRSNYFRVTDEGKLRDIINRCQSEGSVYLYEHDEEKGLFSFSCDGPMPELQCEYGECSLNDKTVNSTVVCSLNTSDSVATGVKIKYCREAQCNNYTPCDVWDECEGCPDLFQELQKIVAENDAIIITEVGNEKLRYLLGVSVVITRRGIRVLRLDDIAWQTAKEMLDNHDFYTQMGN